MNFNHDFNTTPLPPNETKNKKSKKTMKFSQNEKKKKTLYAIILQIHSNANAFLMYEIPNIKIQSNLKRRKHEKTHPFINFRIAFSFHFER
ncbi:hypothetical protein HMPREF1417_01739 [Helicobacter pylori GAM260Bi]|nr:hypothetical protein HMPREF1417_01739 [Helicobacter pylori GAM260Bi]